MSKDFHFEDLLPLILAEDMAAYVLRGVPPGEGSFQEAVLCNDLKESFGRADDVNREALFDIVSWCYCYLPAPAWGSAEKVTAWCALVQEHNERAQAQKDAPSGQGPREGEHRLDSPGLQDREDGDYGKD